MPNSKQCNFVSVLQPAEYICNEIKKNSKSKIIQKIKHLITSYNGNVKRYQSALKKLSPLGRTLVMSSPHFTPYNFNSSYISAAVSDKITGRMKAYKMWKEIVGKEKDWDHKRYITQMFGEWTCDKSKHILFFFDIWSNIHYGFIGKVAGFTEWELLSGAGVAQLRDNKRTAMEWFTHYVENRFRVIGDADFVAAFDDASDNEAIKVGFRLYYQFGHNPSALTAQKIIDEIYKSYNSKKVLSLEECTKNH